MLRLELLLRHGGVYVDSDLEPVRALDPLLRDGKAFAVREDANCIPDFVLGAPPNHPAIRQCLDMVLAMDPAILFNKDGKGPWHSGPGITTQVFTKRDDVTVLPSVTFAPYHWSRKAQDGDKDWTQNPQTYGIHRWAASWSGAQGHQPT